MKTAFDLHMRRHLGVADLPHEVGPFGVERLEFAPRGDFLEWLKAPRVPRTRPPLLERETTLHAGGNGKSETAAMIAKSGLYGRPAATMARICERPGGTGR